ncbi:MAG: sigma 54-interacting transcriptional regulator [Sandaracinaceae bacterium]
MQQTTHTVQLGIRDADILVLRVVAGSDVGLEAMLTEPVTIGTVEATGLCLSDPAVSRVHCEIEVEGAQARLRDLGSKNGTWIGGARVRDAWLVPGARFVVGATTLELGVERRTIRTSEWGGGPLLGPLLGDSDVMRRVFVRVARLANVVEPVLVRGETGTGKELVARALHDIGPRAKGPFVVVDGAALSETLAEMELFGHARGAFTGAVGERAGAFERAHGGTLFIDEVGEIPIELQPRFLRALEDGTVQRLGEGQRRKVDVRVVAATHRPLARMTNERTFREDLYYRLAVFEIALPPLRERGADAVLIARAMLDRIAPGDAAMVQGLEGALAARAGYGWPGNVRELATFVRRFVVLGDGFDADKVGPSASLSDRLDRLDMERPFHDAKRDLVEVFERRYLERLLDETGGNVAEAARRSGLSRGHLTQMLKKHGIGRRLDDDE